MTAGIWIRAVVAAGALWGLASAAGARVQEQGGPPAPDPDGAYVWTGWDGERFVMLDPLALRDEVLSELAAIELAVEAERDFEGALARLVEVWKRAAWVTPYPGQWEALVRTAEVRARVLLALGRVEEAAVAVENLLLDLPSAGIAFEVEAHLLATSDRLEAERAQLADARLASLRAEIARRMGRLLPVEAAAQSGDPLFQEVAKAVERPDPVLIDTLGRSAVPALVALAERSTSAAIPVLEVDPLFHLMRVDEPRAAELALATLDAGYLWRIRLVRAMNALHVLENPGTWDRSVEPPVLLEPQWLQVLEALAADPELVRETLPLIWERWHRIGLTPSLEQVVLDAVRGTDPDASSQVLEFVSHLGNLRTRSVLEALLLDERAHLRRFAAARLGQDANTASSLFDCTDHPDAEVRVAAAKALFVMKPVEMPPIETYAPLASDPDPRVRVQLPEVVKHPDAEGAQDLLLTLARDADPSVLAALDRILINSGELSPAHRLALLRQRWANPRAPIWSTLTPNESEAIGFIIAREPEGARQAAHWYVETEEPARAGVPMATTVAQLLRRGLVDGLQRNDETALPALLELPAAELTALLLVLDRGASSADGRYEQKLLERLFELMLAEPTRYLAALGPVSGDRASLLTQTRALRVRAVAADAGLGEALLEFLRDPRWSGTQLTNELSHELRALAHALPSGPREAVLLRAVRDPACATEPTSQLANDYDPTAADGEELTFAILERWFPGRGAPYMHCVAQALEASARFPARVDGDLLVTATRTPSYAHAAVNALGSLLDPRYLPVLGECLVADWLSGATGVDEIRSAALRAVTRYYSDQAAEVLLHVVKQRIPDGLRIQCFDALDQIRRYQEARADLAARRLQEHARESAIAKLVPGLSDPDPLIRALTARSLGALGAAEALPELMALVRDPDEGVREAARAAIERLTADAGD